MKRRTKTPATLLIASAVVAALVAPQTGQSRQPIAQNVSVQGDADVTLDIHSRRQLCLPTISSGPPAAGRRVCVIPPEYAGTGVHHSIYLPERWRPDWKKTGTRLPIIFEYTGNWFPKAGSTGKVEDAGLGYGLSDGKYIWVVLPCVRADGLANERTWWGDIDKTVEYAKANVPRIVDEFGGDWNAVFLCGFSRGAIGVNFIGLHDDEIAGLWMAFVTHDHFDGVKPWRGTKWGSPLAAYRKAAAERLKRVGGRPYLVIQNGKGYGTDELVRSVLGSADNFTFLDISTEEIFGSFPNDVAQHGHTDRWPLKPSEYRTAAWQWMNRVTANRVDDISEGRLDNDIQGLQDGSLRGIALFRSNVARARSTPRR